MKFLNANIAELDETFVDEESDVAGGPREAGMTGQHFRLFHHAEIGIKNDHAVQHHLDAAGIGDNLLFAGSFRPADLRKGPSNLSARRYREHRRLRRRDSATPQKPFRDGQMDSVTWLRTSFSSNASRQELPGVVLHHFSRHDLTLTHTSMPISAETMLQRSAAWIARDVGGRFNKEAPSNEELVGEIGTMSSTLALSFPAVPKLYPRWKNERAQAASSLAISRCVPFVIG